MSRETINFSLLQLICSKTISSQQSLARWNCFLNIHLLVIGHPDIKIRQQLRKIDFESFEKVYEGFPVITTLDLRMCEKTGTLPFHFDHLPIHVFKSPHWSQDSESEKIPCPFFGGLGIHRPVGLKKAQNIKSQFSFKLLVFLGNDIKNCVLPFFGPPIHTSFVGKLPC